MAGGQQTKRKNPKVRMNMATKDLILLSVFTILMLALSYFLDVFALIVRFLEKHPENIIYIDEVIVGLLSISAGFALFAWRRWMELKEETAKRIKKQEELLRVTETQAQVERIVSKQLRSDMEEMKQDVREILRLLTNKFKRPG